MSKRINLLRNWILVCFVFLAFFVAGIILCSAGVISNRDILTETGYIVLILICYLFTIVVLVVVFRLFAERESLLRCQVWIKTLFVEDVKIPSKERWPLL